MDKTAKKERFEAVFTGPILTELVSAMESQGMPQEVIAWHKENLLYNTIGGKLNRGMSVCDSVEILKGSALSQDEYQEAAILGWCVELVSRETNTAKIPTDILPRTLAPRLAVSTTPRSVADNPKSYFLISDDIMDSSIERRGQPCHYRREGVGMIAINDAFFIETSIYRLLRSHFKSRSYYVDLFDLFQETTEQTVLGQTLDLLTAPEDSVDLSKFSLQKWQTIVIYKTAFYSFYLPVALAMRYRGITNEAAYKQALDILIPMGEYFQAADDALDFSAPPAVIGKIGTDIIDNKCSWPINQSLRYATAEQRKVLDTNYGKKDSAAEAKIKEVYGQPPVSIMERFEKYEAESYAKLNELIDKVDEAGTGMKKEVYRAFLAKVYKRTK